MTYAQIKLMILKGGEPTVGQLNDAIEHQLRRVAAALDSLARNAARLDAAAVHPWPLPEGQKGRVVRRMVRTAQEQRRLTRLYFWREVLEKAPELAPPHVGSGPAPKE